MEANTTAADKRIVNELNFGAKTSKRVGWEAWEFAIEAPHLVRVTNASYGFEKEDHSYLVGIEDRDGVLVPAECECPADKYNEEYDCKHKVALATVGGPVVLQAAVDCPTPTVDTEETTTQTMKERLRADGGTTTKQTDNSSPPLDAQEPEACANGNEWCDGPDRDSLPCFDCYELMEEGE
ncbi:SWIM zinc finger [Halorientalis persicus]|uniref:SWIM zinc finger n=1 Tax=Halorientalis persicus TaxID=1367881 RepID=A0A1H8TE24_9EURY|nr:SWIM zinc finger family protein [Halorientalis persicus]SEO88733.1 SWIM zinc finger [Halorientalis persicus]